VIDVHDMKARASRFTNGPARSFEMSGVRRHLFEPWRDHRSC